MKMGASRADLARSVGHGDEGGDISWELLGVCVSKVAITA